MAEIVTMSSKGQIVVPKDFREQYGYGTGTNFAIFGNDGTIILKKVDVPTAKEVFERVHKWGTQLAKKKGWKEEDFIKRVNTYNKHLLKLKKYRGAKITLPGEFLRFLRTG